MTQQEAYAIHVKQSERVAALTGVNQYDIAKYAMAVNLVENRKLNPNAKNPNSSARGMMQMLIGTQKELETKYLGLPHNPNKIFEPDYAIYLAQYELARQYKRYKGDWRKAVHAYNRGSYQVNKSSSKEFASGENYTTHVINMLYKTDFAALGNPTTNPKLSSTTSLSRKEWS